MFRSTILLVVSLVAFAFVTSDDSEGGRKILGLSGAWNAVHRDSKTVEVVIGSGRKVLVRPLQ
jgi:hypothetical protein